MRIVDVCAFYSPHGGGVKTYVEQKMAIGPLLGHDITILAPGDTHSISERGPHARLITIPAPPPYGVSSTAWCGSSLYVRMSWMPSASSRSSAFLMCRSSPSQPNQAGKSVRMSSESATRESWRVSSR